MTETRRLIDMTEEDLERLFQKYARSQPEPDRWMTIQEAAAYIGKTPNAIHKLTAAKQIPFRQDAPRGKLYFRKTDLDKWRMGECAN